MSRSRSRYSIIIPVKPGGRVAALTAMRLLDYPAADYEVIIAEGTRPSVQRNLAARIATGDMLYFLDDDSLLPVNALSLLDDALLDPEVAVVGGPSLTPATDSALQQTIGYAVQSLLGSGGVRNRYRQAGQRRATDDRELILCNLCFRREIFLASGGLDERLYPNEENELLDRLLRSGYKLLHEPQLAVWRSQRPTFRAFCRQMYGYGRGRGEQTRISHRWQVGTLIPPLFLLYLVSLLFLQALPHLVPLAAYLVLVGFTALQAEATQSVPAIGARLAVVIPTIHLLYGVGIVRGYFRPRFNKTACGDSPVVTRHVKNFDAPWDGRGAYD